MFGFQPISRNLQRSQAPSLGCRRPSPGLLLSALSLAGLAVVSQPAQAQTRNYTNTNTPDGPKIEIWGTGRNADNSAASIPGTAEQNWKLIAFPRSSIYNAYSSVRPSLLDTATCTDVNWHSSPCNTTGQLYIPSTVPGPWYGDSATIIVDGKGYNWITYANWAGVNTGSPLPLGATPTSQPATSYFNPSTGNFGTGWDWSAPAVDKNQGLSSLTPAPNGTLNPAYYSYIVQTFFKPDTTGDYVFTTSITADNFIEVFLGGSVSNADTLTPTITGGNKLLQLAPNNVSGLFANLLTNSSSTISLTAGTTYYLNYVVRNNLSCVPVSGACNPTERPSFGQTGLVVATSAFGPPTSTPVPGPVPALGVAAFLQQARRLRRRIAKRG